MTEDVPSLGCLSLHWIYLKEYFTTTATAMSASMNWLSSSTTTP